MTQSIVLQVGQCGNQIGYSFWDLALREHASINKIGLFDESLSSFFQNVDPRNGERLPASNGLARIKRLKARAVLIDMEEGVVNEIVNKGPLSEVFDSKQLITDVSGSGNNWAVGHLEYGSRYREKLSDVIRHTAEACDCLQCFFCIHSMGGGTGSGLGTYVLRLIQDEYPDVFRFVTAVYPSEDDDVITSPYNSILALRELSEGADCVLPIENQALMDIVQRIDASLSKARRCTGVEHASGVMSSNSLQKIGHGARQPLAEERNSKVRPFDSMNNIVANLLLNLTSSSRFEGSMNVDLNEISMNLVPFPKLHFLSSSITPLCALKDVHIPPRKLDQMFTDAFSKGNQLLRVDPKSGLYLACALMVRGKVDVSDIRRNIDRLKPSLDFVQWNREGWKTGLCSVPPLTGHSSLLTLSNNTCIQYQCLDVRNRFVKLYKRKAHVHHYTQVSGFDESMFNESLHAVDWLVSEYEMLEKSYKNPVMELERLKLA